MMSDLLNNEKNGLLRKILTALAFSALGYCGNYLNIQVAFNVDFIFGSIFAIFAVAALGIGWGIGVSCIASSYTYQLWNHPYAIIIFMAEILWIGLALRRGKKNILLMDSLYWLVLGIPLVVTFYSGVQQLDAQSVAIIALKQPVNGIFNAMVASIVLSHTPVRQWMPGKESTRLPTYATTIFHLIAVSLMVPSLSLLLYMNHREASSQQGQAMARVQTSAYTAGVFIQEWLNIHMNAARVIAGLGEKYPLRPSPELQKELSQIRELFPDYHNVFLGDGNATTIAFDPPTNSRGESTIGIGFADRAWFKQLKNTLKPVVSDVFAGRGGIFSPIFTISVPVVRDEKLAGFSLGGVNLEKLKDHLAGFSHVGDLSLVDQNGNIIVSTNKNRDPLTPLAGTDNGTVVPISSGVSLWVPGTIQNVSIMGVWKGAYYFTRQPIKNTNWTLVAENPVKPMQESLYKSAIWGMGGVAVLYAISMLLALVFSNRLSRSIESLSKITKDIPLKIEKQETIVWPTMDTVEMEQLTHNFKDTESALKKHIQEVRKSNLTLEEKVKERTGELQTERQRLSNILYGTDAGTWEWNVQTGDASFNERWADIVGYALHELEPVSIQTWIGLCHSDDLKFSNELLEKHFKRKLDYYECECRMKHKNGSWVWVLDRARVVSWTEDNKPLIVSGTHQDITERKQTEAELMKSEKRLTLALTATQDSVWDWDLLTDNLYYSPLWWKMLGYETNELKSDSDLWRRFMHPEDLEQANRIVAEAIAKQTSFEVESRLLHKDGHYVPILTRGFLLRDEDGKALRITGTNTDLTERKLMEAERRHMEQHLQQVQKAESLGRMAGAIAHNFNNQLSVVLGNLELALDDLPGDTEIHEFLMEAMKAAQRSSEVSGLMLTYLGQSTGKVEPLDLSEVCRHDLPVLQSTIPQNITLETDFMAPGPVVLANANQVQMILTHLIANGAEAIGDRKGEITLKIKTTPVSDIPKIHIAPIDWKPDADIFACLEVQDTGCGIPDQNMDKIFDPFYTTKFTGRGLGLPMVFGIVKAWNGAVSVESRKGYGSVFCVFLPLATGEISPEAEKAIESDKVDEHGTILLVDDQDLVRKMAGTMLKRLGFCVLAAAGGIEALELFTRHREKICCVVTDLTMPGMDGRETFTALRKIHPDLPVILVSGYDESQAMDRFVSEKPPVFLHKPYSKNEIKTALNKALGFKG
jgi:PAS domain S-box-containing protein